MTPTRTGSPAKGYDEESAYRTLFAELNEIGKQYEDALLNLRDAYDLDAFDSSHAALRKLHASRQDAAREKFRNLAGYGPNPTREMRRNGWD